MKLTIVGLGERPEDLTLGALSRLKACQRVLVRTAEHETSRALAQLGIAFEALDAHYQSDDFDELHESIARDVLNSQQDTVYAVPGGASLGDESVRVLVTQCVKQGHAWEIIPGVDWAGHAAARFGGAGSTTIVSASDIEGFIPDSRHTLIVTEIESALAAGDVKLRLGEYYPDEHSIFLDGRCLPLYELDRQEGYSINTAILIPPAALLELERRDVAHLQQIMRMLRDPIGGCPWDRKQTHASLGKYLVEEAYEVLDAIESGEAERLADELGDVLLQVIFHAQIASEHAEFDLMEVSSAICRKMISRHPHIFADHGSLTEQEINAHWDAIKQEEKGLATPAEVLADVPRGFPALLRAFKVQGKAARFGVQSSGDAAALMSRAHDEQSMGEALFAAADLARRQGIDAELALQKATDGFITRFSPNPSEEDRP